MNKIGQIFDAHSHIINVNKALLQYKDYVDTHIKSNVNSGIIMIHPYIEEIKCKQNRKHHPIIKAVNQKQEAFCSECGTLVKREKSFYRRYNSLLLEYTPIIMETGFIPFPFITCISDSYSINDEVEYFENINKSFYGIKIYTGTSSNILNNCSFNSHYPLIIHTGLWENQFPMSMLHFIEKYEGPVLIAHFAMFDVDFIKRIKDKSNVYFDTCPATCAYNRYFIEKRNGGFINCDGIRQIEDLYYKLIDLVGIKKVIWGTDYPFGNVQDEINIVDRLLLCKAEKKDLLYSNAMRFLNMEK